MPNDGIPFYLKIDSVSVAGGQSHQISDVWVEAGAENLGAYELPCNFPVLQEGNVSFTVSAGIKESGQSNLRVNYPFYQSDTFTLAAARGEKRSHKPVFRYRSGTVFATQEDFEAGSAFDTDMMLANDSNVRYGTRCGVITATTDSSKEARQLATYDLPEGEEIWLEVDYKCEVPFYIGFYGYISGTAIRAPVLFLTATSEWNKVYVKLSNMIAQADADSYNIYFEALRPYGSSGGSVYIDNVKVVY